jgi:hypothetical protein
MAGGSSNVLAFVLGGVMVMLVIVGIVALHGGEFAGGKTSAVTSESPR